MKIIMKYFSCEGRFSRLYTYHIRLLMHFTRVKFLNIPYYLFRSIDKMASIVQKRDFDKQGNNLFHHSLIKIIVLHHLDQLHISWDNFIANDIFTTPPAPLAEGMPSSSHLTDHHVEAILLHLNPLFLFLHLIIHPHYHHHHHHLMIMQGHPTELSSSSLRRKM